MILSRAIWARRRRHLRISSLSRRGWIREVASGACRHACSMDVAREKRQGRHVAMWQVACRDYMSRPRFLPFAQWEPPPTSNPCTHGRFVQSPGQKENPNPNKKGPADERLASLQSKKPATSRVNATREIHLPLPPTRTMQIKVLFEYKKRHKRDN